MYELQKMDGKRVFITGGLGFIGSNIAQRAARLGADVTIYDACLEPYGWNLASISEIRDRVRLVKGDTRDPESLKKSMAGSDFIFDCAAQVSHLISVKNPLLDIDINCKGAMNVLEAARAVADGAKLVYASTRGVTGRMVYNPIDEKHPTEPTDINGIDKLAAEKYYILYNRIHGLKTTAIRINNTYGERMCVRREDYGIVNWWIRQALRNEQIRIYGEGRQTRDFGYVGDAVDAMVLAAQNDRAAGEIFALGTGKETAIADIIGMILRLTGSMMGIENLPWAAERKAIEIGNYAVTPRKITEALGWEPKTGLEEGLKKTVAFYRQRLAEYV